MLEDCIERFATLSGCFFDYRLITVSFVFNEGQDHNDSMVHTVCLYATIGTFFFFQIRKQTFF